MTKTTATTMTRLRTLLHEVTQHQAPVPAGYRFDPRADPPLAPMPGVARTRPNGRHRETIPVAATEGGASPTVMPEDADP